MDQPRELRELPAAAPQSRPRPGPKPLHIHSREQRRQGHWRNERVSSPAYQLLKNWGPFCIWRRTRRECPTTGHARDQHEAEQSRPVEGRESSTLPLARKFLAVVATDINNSHVTRIHFLTTAMFIWTQCSLSAKM